MRKLVFEPSNAKAGGFQVDKDIAPRIIYVAGFIESLENSLRRYIEAAGICLFGGGCCLLAGSQITGCAPRDPISTITDGLDLG